MNVYDEIEHQQIKKRNACDAMPASTDPMSAVLKLSRELDAAKQQIRSMRDTLRAAKLLPTETDLARKAFEYACGEMAGRDDEWFQLVDVLLTPATDFRDASIVMELALAPHHGFFCGGGHTGIFIEELARLFTSFRKQIFDAYNGLNGDTELKINLTHLQLSGGDGGSFARWEKHALKQSAPAVEPTAITPKVKSL